MEENEEVKVEETRVEETPRRVTKKPKALLLRVEIPKVDSLEVIRARKQAHQLNLRGGK